MMSNQVLKTIAQELRERADQLEGLISVAPTPAPSVSVPSAKPPAKAEAKTEDFFADYGAVYDFLRDNKMLGPKISKEEYEGCDSIILACARDGWGVSWIAYALATTYHETAHTMESIPEYGGNAYFHRMYDIQGHRPAKARELGNLQPGDGVRFKGRSYPQLTGRTNYDRATRKLQARGWDVDLVANPDQMLRPDVGAAVLVMGMREGWFTGRDIDDDLPVKGAATLQQFVASRDIINGRDKAQTIAEYAMDFQAALMAGGYR